MVVGGVKENRGSKDNSVVASKNISRFLVVLLCILVILIVVLLVFIVIINLNNSRSLSNVIDNELNEYVKIYEENDLEISDSEMALIISNEIEEKLNNNEYSVEDAKSYFLQEINKTEDNNKKVQLISYMVNMLMNYDSDFERTIDILKSYENEFVTDLDKFGYYAQLKDLYEIIGRNDLADECDIAMNNMALDIEHSETNNNSEIENE